VKETISLTVLVDLEHDDTEHARAETIDCLLRVLTSRSAQGYGRGGSFAFSNTRPLRATIAPVVDAKPPRKRRARKAAAR
jgi:hypothetical protein